jgi:hypothetical protein
MESAELEALLEKWEPMLSFEGIPKIKDRHRLTTTAVLLENQLKANRETNKRDHDLSLTRLLTEAAPGNSMGTSATPWSNNGNVDLVDPVLISMVRRTMPNLMAYDVCGVQPMSGPVGLIFALRHRYSTQTGIEALFNEANTTFTAAAAGNTAAAVAANNQTGSDPSILISTGNTAYTFGQAMTTAQGEALGDGTSNDFPAMAFSIERIAVTAGERAVKAEYTHELAQDLKAVHGLDAETELANMLSTEILAEINRQVIRSIYISAKIGAQQTTTAGYFDLDVDSNGRWMEEKFKGLLYFLQQEANAIIPDTRAGKGNIVITSPDVASALNMVGILKASDVGDLVVDAMGNTFVGTIQGTMKVYIDPYFTSSVGNHFVVVGYKGVSPFDAGLFYCPYVPLQMYKVLDNKTFQPKLGFKTRYGLVAHPFATAAADGKVSAGAANKNKYYRIFAAQNLI